MYFDARSDSEAVLGQAPTFLLFMLDGKENGLAANQVVSTN
jgi:hypothetical protein